MRVFIRLLLHPRCICIYTRCPVTPTVYTKEAFSWDRDLSRRILVNMSKIHDSYANTAIWIITVNYVSAQIDLRNTVFFSIYNLS